MQGFVHRLEIAVDIAKASSVSRDQWGDRIMNETRLDTEKLRIPQHEFVERLHRTQAAAGTRGLAGLLVVRRSFSDRPGPLACQLSGKDPARIDRIGAYAARWAAKTVVAAGLAESCEVQLSWTIGLARPVSLVVETFGTGRITEEAIAERLARVFDFRPAAIVRAFDLRRLSARNPDGFFARLAAYGQVGRTDLDLPWERLDRVEALAAG